MGCEASPKNTAAAHSTPSKKHDSDDMANLLPFKPDMRRSFGLHLTGLALRIWVYYHSLMVWRASSWNLPVSQNMPPLQMAFVCAFYTTLGFSLPANLSRMAWENQKPIVTAIHVSCFFAELFAVGLVFAYWPSKF